LPTLAYDLHGLARALEAITRVGIFDLLALGPISIHEIVWLFAWGWSEVFLAFFIYKGNHLLTIDHSLEWFQPPWLGRTTLGLVTRWVRHFVGVGFEPRDSLTFTDYTSGDVNLCVTGVAATKHIVTTITVRNCKLSGVYPAHYIILHDNI
jgi:hypothetical protein